MVLNLVNASGYNECIHFKQRSNHPSDENMNFIILIQSFEEELSEALHAFEVSIS